MNNLDQDLERDLDTERGGDHLVEGTGKPPKPCAVESPESAMMARGSREIELNLDRVVAPVEAVSEPKVVTTVEDAEVKVEEAAQVANPSADEASSEEEPPKISRKVRRRRKRSRPRSKTIAMKRLTREELRVGRLLYPPVDIPRPATRAECGAETRPCPWVACKHHLYLDVNPETGSIKINFPDLEPWEMGQTCALDVSDRGGITLEEVGEIMNLTRERIRQVEVRGLLTLKMASPSPEELGVGLLNPEE